MIHLYMYIHSYTYCNPKIDRKSRNPEYMRKIIEIPSWKHGSIIF